ncbi:polyprenol-phosphate-mannose-dependent alpha-(1-2)-phosphatidylinositol pentamannoside mannosyltransferase [Rhodococcoides trifolii]|uniref:Polyprenol-phosphate-mannose-dependent alpha-(1-2)-phosphatidylinositol pentamannoside mannosyltransferase n=1 Tax=Rhodococcoides trifolii TaxID=908250 RepID=A0A917LDC3_9NOCA|nr:mannosyltransferase [Rhodococcus trifolii]GGG15048.1 polyprenol-phosphate-mannose-dependent alpha-(1-2)-phosphatidylinositol pentamannoside mannosyltransferase [Rhodococcus trifolii]
MTSVPRERLHPLLRAAPYLLAVTLLFRLVWTFFTANGMNWVDLHVYVDGSASLVGGDLYRFVYADQTPDFPLPFTYPPFAAVVFFPLHFLPFTVVGIAWQVATIAALYVVVRISLRLVVGDRADLPSWRRAALLWTAVGIWTESMRTTMDYGQVNVFLVLGGMVAVRSSRSWLSGGIVGFVAGIKLTPAITGLYFLAQRRWKAAALSAVAFFATVAVSWLIASEQARQYFTEILGDANRIGPVASVWNQSLRGALSRIMGRDVGNGPLWLICAVVLLALAFLAWRALRRDDRLGTMLIVQFVGLLLSPISWSHHWVWVVPLFVWLLHGPYGTYLGTRIVAGYWLVTTLVGVPWILSFFQPSIWEVQRPALLAWLGTVDVVGSVLLFGWIAYVGRRTTGPVPADRSRRREPRPSS